MDGAPSFSDLLAPRGWLLVLIAILAFRPASYVWRYIEHAPSRRDITRPPEVHHWRTPGQLRLNLLLLTGCLGFAVFIFTPAAERLARSPAFLPMLGGAAGALILSSVIRGLQLGRIEPLTRGFSATYEREEQPKRFWASLSWNSLVGMTLIWVALTFDERSTQCFDTHTAEAAERAVDACTELLAEAPSSERRADLLAARGSAHYELNDYPRALHDYAQAIRLDPKDDSSHYNRGLIYQDVADVWNAASEFEAAAAIDPDDEDNRARLAEVRAILNKE